METTPLPTPAQVQMEMAFTTWEQSCKEPAVVDGDLRECRRGAAHRGNSFHASGFGPGYKTW